MKALAAGDLSERVRAEQLSGSAWVAVAVMAASVLPGGSASQPPVLIPELAIASPVQPYQVRVRYRTDLAPNMRIRWGRKTLAIDTVVDPDNHRHELLLQTGTVPSYVDLHAAALAAIAREGFAITFAKDSSSGYDSPTDTAADPPASTTSIAGYAKWLNDDTPMSFAPQTLVETEAPRLLFIPSTLGQLPEPGAICTAGADDYVTAKISPIAPDAAAIGAYITVTR